MGLNIKNERVHDLAREAARVTGKSQTGAIEEALERLLAEHDTAAAADRQRRYDAITEIGRRYREEAERLGPDHQTFEIEDLYDDETGLPR